MKRVNNQFLEQSLRNEAQRIRAHSPSFSQELHDRMINALRTAGLPQESEENPSHRWSIWRIAAPLGLAAAVALGAWLLIKAPAPPPAPAPELAIPSVPKIELQNRVAPAEAALDQQKYAYLDRDAQNLVIFIADQLPQFPTNQPAKH